MSWLSFLLKAGISTTGRRVQLIGAGGGFDARLLGAGSSSSTAKVNVANSKILCFYLEHQATSGDNRGMYFRTYFNGGSGDNIRSFATGKTDMTGIFGLHSSYSMTATKKVTGLAAAVRSTWQIPNEAIPAGGTYTSLHVEAYCEGTSSDPGAATAHSLIRAEVGGGNATSQGKVVNFLDLICVDGSGKMVYTAQNEPTWTSKTALIKCLINGAVHYLIAVAP